MTSPPAAWYDDPEDPTQYRYWDGANWTEHRAPKTPPPPSSATADESAWNIFPHAFNAIGSTWRSLLLISVPNLIMSVVLLVAIYATVDQVFDGELDEVIDRAADGVISSADEAFYRSLDPTFPVPMFWVALILGVVSLLVGVVVAAALERTLASAMRGHTLEPADAFSGTMRRLGRLVGWPLLLGFMGVVALIPGLVFPPLLLLYLPLVIWLWPYLMGLLPAIALAPAGRSPIAQTRAMVSGRWGHVARRALVLAVLWFAVSFSAAIANQFFAFDLRASVVGSTFIGVVQGALIAAGVTAYWIVCRGELDPELESASSTAPGEADG